MAEDNTIYEDINISSHQQIIKNHNGDKIKSKVFVTANADFKYLFLCSDSEINIDFITQGENIKGDIYVIFYGNKPISANILSHIKHSLSHINILLLSFIQNDELFDIQGSINLAKDISNSQGHLLEKNIILGDKVKIKALPRLDVYSNDVQATHGVSIERINKDNLFYLKSKGLDEDLSKELIIRGNITNILNQFTQISDEEKIDIENTILSKITN